MWPNKSAVLSLIIFLCTLSLTSQNFVDQQLRYKRVKKAKKEKDFSLKHYFESKGLEYEVHNIYIRAFKQEKVLQVWIQQHVEEDYFLLKEYLFCSSSGQLGPKLKEGDEQIPEGFYFINKFNPTSDYYLSLKVNYPNPSDLGRADRARPGGGIFIHGKCVTIGCIPITDDGIKELYWLSVQAYDNGQKNIPVHIFPFKYDHANFSTHEFYDDPKLHKFWDNLEEGYYYFERKRRPPFVHIKSDGTYAFF